METSSIYKACFIVGGILLLLAIGYSYYAKANKKSNVIKKIFWISGDLLLIIGIIGQYLLGKDVLMSAIMLIIVNYAIWNQNRKEKE